MQTRAPLSRDNGAFTIHKEGGENCYAKVKPKEPASGRLYAVFHVFGAGNLIFPPYLGMHRRALTRGWPLCRICGQRDRSPGYWRDRCRACRRAVELAGRVHPRFAQIFALLVYLSIGPCLAIPRGGASFQMLAPLIGGDAMRQLIYSIVFFAAAFFRCTAPGKS